MNTDTYAAGSTGDRRRTRADGDAAATAWAELAAEMRRIKRASELSYGRLAQRTHYSSSSWERFLNQKQLPTRVAVEQFAAAAGQDPGPLLLRLDRLLEHEAARRAATTRDAAAPVPPAPRGPRPAGWSHHTRPFGLMAAGAVLGGLVTAAVREAGLRRTPPPR